jgi:hypothetical protein
MSDFQLNSVITPPPVSQVQQIVPPGPPKSQSDHKPANPATSSRGPAVVLSGALAKGAERHGQQAQPETPPPSATGQHINHVI